MKLKDILPYEDYVIKSDLSVEEVNFRLNENIAPKDKSIFSAFSKNTTKLYKGELYGNRFNISRVISYQNSFLPTITGDIFTLKGFTHIKLKMNPNRIILIIWYIAIPIMWFLMLSFNNLFETVSTKSNLPFADIVFKFLPIILLLTPLIAFKIESRKSKKFLSSLLEEKN